jgi:undecaprenyl-phosphate 4-deoxy-4-formamido-L-arabinose transferase
VTNKELIDVSVVVPCYKSENFLKEVVESVYQELKMLQGQTINKFEINLVVDGSPDETYKIAFELAETYEEIRSFELTRNFGQHSAIFAGVENSRMSWILTMDDDGQHPPAQISKLIDLVGDDVDVIYGKSSVEEHNFIRNLFSQSSKYLIYKILDVKYAKNVSAFRLFRRSLLENINLSSLNNGVVDVVINWHTDRIQSVEVKMLKRAQGDSNYNYQGLTKFALQMITGYSVKPLRMVTALGFVAFVLSMFTALLVLVQSIMDVIEVPGYASIVFITLILGSFQIFALGIIGEYIGRIHEKTLGKPLFKVRKADENQN